MKRLLLLIVLAIQTGCTSWQYHIDGEKVFFGIRSWNHGPLDYAVPGADAATFRTLKDGYALDRAHVYLKGEIIPNADPASFEVLKDGYAKDRRHVFLSRCSLEGADPASWKLIAEYWSRDAKRVYQGHSVVPGAKPETFRFVRDNWAIDGSRALHHLALYSDDCGVSSEFLRLTTFDGIDPSTFEVIDSFNAKDAKKHYDALKKPNQSLEPTPTSVTPRACARVAPAAVVAHL